MRSRAPGGPDPLTRYYRSPAITYAALPIVAITALCAYALDCSPLPPRGDMRRAYRFTRAALVAGLVAGLLAICSRLVLTGVFATFVSADLSHLTAFNVAVSVLSSSAVVAVAATRPAARHALWRRLPVRVRLRLARRRAARPAPPDRL